MGGSQWRSVRKSVGLSVMPEIERIQQADLQAFNHLAERFADAAKERPEGPYKDAMELLRRLQSDFLYPLHYLDRLGTDSDSVQVTEATVQAVIKAMGDAAAQAPKIATNGLAGVDLLQLSQDIAAIRGTLRKDGSTNATT